MKKVVFASINVALFFAASCSKPKEHISNSYSSLATALYDVAPASKITIIDAGTGGSFYGNSGIRYVFPPNSFRTATGGVVTGSVSIQTAGFLTKSDMILSEVLPISNGEPLISAGESYIKATQGNTEVFMATGKNYTINFPQKGTPVAGMGLFLSPGDPASTAQVNWAASIDSAHGAIIYNGDTIAIFSDSMHFVNADRFLATPNYQSFTVIPKVDGKTITAQTLAYASFDTYNSVWKMKTITNGIIGETHVPDIPVHFVVMANVDNGFYAGVLAATPKNGTVYSIPLTQMTPAAFKQLLDAL